MLTLPPYLSVFFSCSVIFPQVEYNSYLPKGVMNGRPLLKCLSITFECSLALTSEKHTRWEHTHKHITGGLSLCGHTSWGGIFLRLGGFFFFNLTCAYLIFWWFSAHSSRRRGTAGVVSLVITPAISFGVRDGYISAVVLSKTWVLLRTVYDLSACGSLPLGSSANYLNVWKWVIIIFLRWK